MLKALVNKVYAIDNPLPPGNPGGGWNNIQDAIATIFQVAVLAAGAIFVVLFLVGGIQYLTSAGNEEATGKAKKLLVDAIIGLVIVLVAWAAGTWILNALGFQGGQLFS